MMHITEICINTYIMFIRIVLSAPNARFHATTTPTKKEEKMKSTCYVPDDEVVLTEKLCTMDNKCN